MIVKPLKIHLSSVKNHPKKKNFVITYTNVHSRNSTYCEKTLLPIN